MAPLRGPRPPLWEILDPPLLWVSYVHHTAQLVYEANHVECLKKVITRFIRAIFFCGLLLNCVRENI